MSWSRAGEGGLHTTDETNKNGAVKHRMPLPGFLSQGQGFSLANQAGYA